ncbi:MAG: hypothetical protein ACP5E4_04810 [Candidatus Aenigmatarchaeota archaeon]
MKLAVLLLGVALMWSLNPALASFQMTSEVSCGGACDMVQTYNGETVSVMSEGDIKMSTKADGSGVEMKVEVNGEGTATIDADGEAKTISSSGASSGTSSAGSSPSGDSPLDGNSEALCVAENVDQNGTEEPVSHKGTNASAAADGESGRAGGAVSGFNWFGAGEVVKVYSDGSGGGETSNSQKEISVEVNADGSEEKIQTSGTLHRVYTFFKSFVAHIRIS